MVLCISLSCRQLSFVYSVEVMVDYDNVLENCCQLAEFVLDKVSHGVYFARYGITCP